MIRPDDLAPEEIAVGTTRMVRLRRIGTIYFLENNQPHRTPDNQLVDQWKVVARCDERDEGMEALDDTNQRIAEMIRRDKRRPS